jgi:hypothetical protein
MLDVDFIYALHTHDGSMPDTSPLKLERRNAQDATAHLLHMLVVCLCYGFCVETYMLASQCLCLHGV